MYSQPLTFGKSSGGNMKTYYVNQAGSGIGGFAGARFQRGQGFGSFFMPLLRYLGPKLLSTGASIASDAISGENILDSLKTRGKKLSRVVAHDAAERAEKYSQTGQGRRRRKKRTTVPKKRAIKRVTKPTIKHKRRRVVKRKTIKSKNPISIFS